MKAMAALFLKNGSDKTKTGNLLFPVCFFICKSMTIPVLSAIYE